MDTIRVFVYGTLKAGRGNHRLLEKATFDGIAEIGQDNFIMLNLGAYPAIIRSKDGPTIKGETYLVDEATLKRLDWLEGYPNLYNRETILVHREDGSSVEALVYYMEHKGLNNYHNIIESGEW